VLCSCGGPCFKPSKDRYKPCFVIWNLTTAMKVSNPQRIATNNVLRLSNYERISAFQTLKGSLQTVGLKRLS